MLHAFQQHIDTHGLGTNVPKPSPISPKRFRLQAVSAYLQRPAIPDDLPVQEVERYWEHGSYCNAMMDRVGEISTMTVVDQAVEGVMTSMPKMLTLTGELSAR